MEDKDSPTGTSVVDKGVIESVTINDEPLDLEASYRIGTFEFLASGGDNFRVFAESEKRVDTGLLDWESWLDYLATGTQDQPIEPDFVRQGVQVEGLPTGEVEAGSTLELTYSGMNIHSIGAPANTEITVSVDGAEFTAPIVTARDGTAWVDSATVTLTVPEGEGETAVSATAAPTSTTATNTITITGTVPAATVDLQILNINDFHGRIEGKLSEDKDALTASLAIRFAATIDELRDDFGADRSVLLSAGDNVGATLFASSIADDVPTIEMLNALGLAATAVGNHEFDKGWLDVENRLQDLFDGPILGANVYLKGTTTPVLPEYTILDVNGI